MLKTDLVNVLFVPELAVNLLSSSRALDKGYEMHSNKNGCELVDQTGKTSAITETDDNLFKMKFKIEKKKQVSVILCLT